MRLGEDFLDEFRCRSDEPPEARGDIIIHIGPPKTHLLSRADQVRGERVGCF